jgi:hypothetical protein
MKPFLPTLIIAMLLAFADSISAQDTIYYGYDDSGNRTIRTIKLSEIPSKGETVYQNYNAEESNTSQESNTAEEKKEVFNDVLGEQKITIYPNPTRGQLNVIITGSDFSKNSGIYVYNLSGRLLIRQSPVTGNDIIDLSPYIKGMYVLKIILGDKTSDWKIIKE